MAKTLSLDLRERVLAAVSNGMSRRQAAERFGVSAASAIRWCARQRETGSAASKPRGGDRLSARIEAQANLILSAGGRDLRHHADGASSQTGRARASLRHRHALALLRSPRHHVEKKTAHASEQDRPDILKRREDWFDGQLDLDPERLVFIDETWASTNMARDARAGAERRTAACRRSTRPLENDDLRRRTSVDGNGRAHGARWANQRRRFPGLCRSGSRPRTASRRHRRHGQSRQPQGRWRAQGHRGGGSDSCSIFRLTAPTSIRSRRPSRNSRRCCERPPNEPSTAFGTRSANSCQPSRHQPSRQENAKTSSPPPDMSHNEWKPL